MDGLVCRTDRSPPVDQLLRLCDHLTRPLWSRPSTSLRRSYESVRPSAPPRYARLAVVVAWASPFPSERLVPAVPRHSLHPLCAPSTPLAVRSVIRPPADLSQVDHTLPVSRLLSFNDAPSKGSVSFVSRMLRVATGCCSAALAHAMHRVSAEFKALWILGGALVLPSSFPQQFRLRISGARRFVLR